ncbi:MAG: 4Fe-4S binding protein [Deltaproteobacteria bacterium]|nr:4Fe-4S binding protein [Deltaproteobacteria bacterium]
MKKSLTDDKTEIDIFKAWCKSCGICVAFCPSGALAIDDAGAPFVKDAQKCVRCGQCELRCPDFAISVSPPREPGKGDKVQ